MELKDIVFEPHNDMGAEDIELMKKYQSLLTNGDYSDATALLENSNYKKGIRASLLNSIKTKIEKIEISLLNGFVADKDEYYSSEEPDRSFMEENGYKFWCKLY